MDNIININLFVYGIRPLPENAGSIISITKARDFNL
jgi:hypothetical protein